MIAALLVVAVVFGSGLLTGLILARRDTPAGGIDQWRRQQEALEYARLLHPSWKPEQ